jgi:hypothetical protein
MDDVSITQEQTPISVFMPYPNFKGMMFDDQSQTAVFTVVPTPTQGAIPIDTTLTDYRIDGTVSCWYVVHWRYDAIDGILVHFRHSSRERCDRNP